MKKFTAATTKKAKSTPVQCPQCHKTYGKKCNLAAHIKSVHGGEKFMCNICSQKLSSAFRIRLHISSVHKVASQNNFQKIIDTIEFDYPKVPNEQKDEVIENQKISIADLQSELKKIEKENSRLQRRLVNKKESLNKKTARVIMEQSK